MPNDYILTKKTAVKRRTADMMTAPKKSHAENRRSGRSALRLRVWMLRLEVTPGIWVSCARRRRGEGGSDGAKEAGGEGHAPSPDFTARRHTHQRGFGGEVG
jgi:hypothetical protein